jgi:hypothetical protein
VRSNPGTLRAFKYEPPVYKTLWIAGHQHAENEVRTAHCREFALVLAEVDPPTTTVRCTLCLLSDGIVAWVRHGQIERFVEIPWC